MKRTSIGRASVRALVEEQEAERQSAGRAGGLRVGRCAGINNREPEVTNLVVIDPTHDDAIELEWRVAQCDGLVDGAQHLLQAGGRARVSQGGRRRVWCRGEKGRKARAL
eukprot:scaffold77691_cov30-Tisochrysis_lutea.AAC.2